MDEAPDGETILLTQDVSVIPSGNVLTDANNVLEGIAGVEGSISDKTFTVSGMSTDLLKQGSETLIFDCGTSAV